jgi:predicted transcriptional regulator
VGTEADEAQNDSVVFAIDEQKVRLDVALAIAGPIATQVMVALMRRQRLIIRQGFQNGHEVYVERC